MSDTVQRKLIRDHIAAKLIIEMKRQLDKHDKVVTGNAKESLRYIPDDQTIVSDLIYVWNIEWGRKAGSRAPPPEPIIRWLERKIGMSRKEAVKKVYPVMKKISEDGIPMTRFVKLAIESYISKEGSK